MKHIPSLQPRIYCRDNWAEPLGPGNADLRNHGFETQCHCRQWDISYEQSVWTFLLDVNTPAAQLPTAIDTSRSSSAPVGDRRTNPSSPMISRPRWNSFCCRLSSLLSISGPSGPLYLVFTGATPPDAVTQPVHFSKMTLLDSSVFRMVMVFERPAPAGWHGWKQPSFQPVAGNSPICS